MLVLVCYPGDEGMSYVAPSASIEDKFLFKDAVSELGADIIGESLHVTYGTWPMYSKFFDYNPPLVCDHSDERHTEKWVVYANDYIAAK